MEQRERERQKEREKDRMRAREQEGRRESKGDAESAGFVLVRYHAMKPESTTTDLHIWQQHGCFAQHDLMG